MPPSTTVFGDIKDIPVGTTWKNRADCSKDGVHRPRYAGISGGKLKGCPSIVISGSYEDDDDKGDYLIYTGTGAQDMVSSNSIHLTSEQVRNQSFEHCHNGALQTSYYRRLPVRVVRGSKLNSIYAPWIGYWYDGLYKVEKTSESIGKSGFQICRYDLQCLPGQPPIPTRYPWLKAPVEQVTQPQPHPLRQSQSEDSDELLLQAELTLEEKILALDKEIEQYKRLLLSAMLINSNPGTWWPLAAARSAGMYRYWSWGALSAQYIVPTRIVYVLLEFTMSVQASCAAPVVLPPVSFAFHFISHFSPG